MDFFALAINTEPLRQVSAKRRLHHVGWLQLTPAKSSKFTFTECMYYGFSLMTTNRAYIIITNATIRQHIPHWYTIVITQTQEIYNFWQHIHFPYPTSPKRGARNH